MTRGGHGGRACRSSSSARRRRRRRPASTCSSSTGARLPAVELPVAAVERARRLVRRVAGGARAVPARGVRRLPRGVARGSADQRPDLRDRLGAGRLRRPTTRSRSRGCWPSTAATSSTSRPVRSRRSSGPRSAAATRRRSPTGSATRSGSRRSRSARSRATTTSTRSSLAGRADLCALARPHLYDPHWTLHAAAEQEYDAVAWVPQYQAGSRKPPAGRRPRPQGARADLRRRSRRISPVSASAREPGLRGAEPLQPQDLVITLLGTYVRPFGRAVWSGGLVDAAAGSSGSRDGAARVALTRLVRRGLIARVRSGRLVHYRLTAAVRAAARRGRRADLLARRSARRTHGTWTVLWHQIPEERRLERSRLGASAAVPRLRLGAGQRVGLARTTTPPRSCELLDELGVVGIRDACSCARPGGGRRAAGAGRAGVGPERAGRALRGVLLGVLAVPARSRRSGLSDADAFLVRTRLVHLFRGFPLARPRAARRARAAVCARGRGRRRRSTRCTRGWRRRRSATSTR